MIDEQTHKSLFFTNWH